MEYGPQEPWKSQERRMAGLYKGQDPGRGIPGTLYGGLSPVACGRQVLPDPWPPSRDLKKNAKAARRPEVMSMAFLWSQRGSAWEAAAVKTNGTSVIPREDGGGVDVVEGFRGDALAWIQGIREGRAAVLLVRGRGVRVNGSPVWFRWLQERDEIRIQNGARLRFSLESSRPPS